ncbi:MAG: metallophosphoesterase family protein, partial [Planctomycetota bacterium]
IDRESEDTGRGKFRTVVHKVQQLSVQPDFMLILGDVHGGPVKEVLAETNFHLPIHVVFGNADDGASRRALRAMFDGKFIGICNAVPGDHVGHLNSEFYRGLRQCSWLEGQLAEGGKLHDHTFAFAHIPLHPRCEEANYYLAINDQKFLRRLILEHQPTALFFGHLHRLETFTIGRTGIFSVHGSNWTNTLVPPPHDPIGFNVAHVYEHGVTLEFVPIDPARE